jgi:sorbitol/mannitol transport system permease protein
MTQVATAPAPARPVNRVGRAPSARTRWARRAPLLPALIFAIIVTQVPFLVTLYLSTLSWNALRPG